MSNRELFISKLVELLVEIDMGPLQFEEPLPGQVERGIMTAIVGFGSEALHALHQSITDDFGIYIIDVLGEIGDNSSIDYLIYCHERSDFMSGLTAIINLSKFKANHQVYTYFFDLLLEAAEGNKKRVSTFNELTRAIEYIGDWKDDKTINLLRQLLLVDQGDTEVILASAEALAKNPENHTYLYEFANTHQHLKEQVLKIISKYDH